MARTFNLTLTGAQEAPTPVASGAIGTGTVLWDEAAGTAAYTFTVAGLDFGPVLGLTPQTASTGDDVTIMHVHNAPRGVAGPIVFGLIGPAQDTDDLSVTPSPDGSWTVSGVWEATDPANVSIAAFADALTAAFAGDEVPLYFNVHTRSFPAGEIRGQWVAGDGAGGLGHLGDFDGDGQADILWRGRAGEAVVWTMDGAQVAGAAELPNPTAYWAVA
jgi:serralysin